MTNYYSHDPQRFWELSGHNETMVPDTLTILLTHGNVYARVHADMHAHTQKHLDAHTYAITMHTRPHSLVPHTCPYEMYTIQDGHPSDAAAARCSDAQREVRPCYTLSPRAQTFSHHQHHHYNNSYNPHKPHRSCCDALKPSLALLVILSTCNAKTVN
jgi:hypothetical protein